MFDFLEMNTKEKEFVSSLLKIDENEKVSQCAQRVIDWNFAARGKHALSTSELLFQWELVEEEYNELYELGISKNNRKEVIDALCDLFVVSVYADFQTRSLHETYKDGPYDIFPYVTEKNSDIFDNLSILTYYVGQQLANGVVRNTIEIMRKFNFDYIDALEEVLDSNDSKIPTVEEFNKEFYKQHFYFSENDVALEEMIQLESDLIEKRNKGRYTGVKGNVVKVNGVDRVVWKDCNGKIMKPLTYFEAKLGGF